VTHFLKIIGKTRQIFCFQHKNLYPRSAIGGKKRFSARPRKSFFVFFNDKVFSFF